MKFYVAGGAVDFEKNKELISIVRSFNQVITFDWTHLEEEGGQGKILPTWVDRTDEAEAHSEKERRGVLDADVLILNVPSSAGRGLGCFIEFGIAAGVRKNIWLLGYDVAPRDSVFYYLNGVYRMSYTELLDTLEAIQKIEELDNIQGQLNPHLSPHTYKRITTLWGDSR